jgi:hypothetical protein
VIDVDFHFCLLTRSILCGIDCARIKDKTKAIGNESPPQAIDLNKFGGKFFITEYATCFL